MSLKQNIHRANLYVWSKKKCVHIAFSKKNIIFAWAHRICQSKGTPIHKSLSIISYREFFFWLFPLNTFHWINQAQMTANNSRPTILSTEIFRHLNGVLKKSRLGYFLIRFCDPEHLMQQKKISLDDDKRLRCLPFFSIEFLCQIVVVLRVHIYSVSKMKSWVFDSIMHEMTAKPLLINYVASFLCDMMAARKYIT